MATLQHDSYMLVAPLLIDPHVLPSTFLFFLSFFFFNEKTKPKERKTLDGGKCSFVRRRKRKNITQRSKCVNHEVSRRKNTLTEERKKLF